MKKMMILISAVAMAFAASGKDMLRTNFERQDQDGDGKISAQEYLDAKEKFAKSKGKSVNPKMVQNIFKKKDTDGDGFLSYAEFLPKK